LPHVEEIEPLVRPHNRVLCQLFSRLTIFQEHCAESHERPLESLDDDRIRLCIARADRPHGVRDFAVVIEMVRRHKSFLHADDPSSL
jgi:hypothetical protein